MDYLFSQKNSIEALEVDIDPYPLIWYILKARNDKLLREIDRDPFELIRYAEGEFQSWFTANEPTTESISTPATTSKVLRLESICLIDDSWPSKSIFSGYGWMRKDSNGGT